MDATPAKLEPPGTKSNGQSSWNDNTVYAIGVYAMIGRTLGIWPLGCDNIVTTICFLIVVMLQLFLNYSLIQEFVNGCVSVSHAVDFIGVIGTTTVSLLKLFIIRLHRKEMHDLVVSALKDWSHARDERSLNIMLRYAYLGRIVSIFQFGSAFASFIVILVRAPPSLQINTELSSIVNRTIANDDSASSTILRNLPMGSGCSVVNLPIFVYLAFYGFQFIQIITLVICLMGCDTLLFGMSMHMCAQFELLNIALTEFGDKQQHSPRNTGLTSELANLIERHNHLSRQVGLVEDVFHFVILAQLISSTLHIGLIGIEILFQLQNGEYMGFLYSSIAISSLLLQIYLYSYAGECLTLRVKEIRDAAYNCLWYNFPPNLARNVLFIITRTNRPFHLTAGKICRMNNQSFTSLMKTLATLFSVLKLTILD